MTGILNYEMGNLRSVCNAFDLLGEEVRIISRPEELSEVDRIVMPGVGAFRDCIQKIRDAGFEQPLHEAVLGTRKPVLGICLGMQIMASRSFEFGEHTGLGWFDADVVTLKELQPDLSVPHVGWNDIRSIAGASLFAGLPPAPDMYFVHSFYVKIKNQSDVAAYVNYGSEFPSALQKNNIFAVQFHPEKSQDYGMKILENFLRWTP